MTRLLRVELVYFFTMTIFFGISIKTILALQASEIDTRYKISFTSDPKDPIFHKFFLTKVQDINNSKKDELVSYKQFGRSSAGNLTIITIAMHKCNELSLDDNCVDTNKKIQHIVYTLQLNNTWKSITEPKNGINYIHTHSFYPNDTKHEMEYYVGYHYLGLVALMWTYQMTVEVY